MSGTAARFDAWSKGRNYDGYMGRWSRAMAPRFLDWFDPGRGLDWLELGCGTGALTEAILARAEPSSLIGIDASEEFIGQARERLGDRADLRVGDAQAPGVEAGSRDVVASGLLLNFLPDREAALTEWRRALRPGGLLGFYVWDYPSGGLEFLSAFWRAAVAVDPGVEELTERRRFPFCTAEELTGLVRGAGFTEVVCEGLEIPTVFADFDDYWVPFTQGSGPAPGWCATLDPERREQLRERLRADLGAGPIALRARAWALQGWAA